MRKLILLSLLFICKLSFAQITYFNSASNPTDNGTSAATTVAVTPPGSMVSHDLVILVAYQRGTATFSISQASGQTWNTLTRHQGTTATLSMQVFWCEWNGTWGSDPSILFSAGTNTNVVMHVFHPTSSSYTWTLEQNLGYLSLAAASPMSNTTLGFSSTSHASTISLSIWATDDDNSWGTLAGSGWVVTGNAQYRNTSGSDVSSTYAHNIRTTTGTPVTPDKSQTVNGNDPGIVGGFIWYETLVSARPRRINLITKK